MSGDALQLPLAVELKVFAAGAFIDDSTIRATVLSLASLYCIAGRQFVLKADGKLASDIQLLNSKLHSAIRLLPAKCYLVLELTFERMAEICELGDSVLLEPTVFPSISVFVERGTEQEVAAQISYCLIKLQEYSGISIGVCLLIDEPFAHLGGILKALQHDVVRLVRVCVQRSPRRIITAVQNGTGLVLESPPPVDDVPHGSVDLHRVLCQIEQDTTRTLQVADWAAGSCLVLLEPLLELLEYGSFIIRPSPVAGTNAAAWENAATAITTTAA